MRRLLAHEGLPQPDDVEYREDEEELVLFWTESKVAVVIECGEPRGHPSAGPDFEPGHDGL